MKNRWLLRILSVSVCLVLILGLCACGQQSGIGRTEKEQTVVVQGDGQSINLLDYQIYYFGQVNNTIASSSSSSSLNLDTTKSLKDQTCSLDTTKTWAEYFTEETLKACQEILAGVIAAENAGITADETVQQKVQSSLDSITSAAQSAGQSETEYLEELYGKDITMDDMKRVFERYELYDLYMQQQQSGVEVTDEQAEAYYQQHRSQIDTLTVRIAAFLYNGSMTGETLTQEEALQRAEEFKNKVTDEASFVEYFSATLTDTQAIFYSNTDISKSYNITRDAFGADTESADYMFDDARQYGDMRIVDTGSATLVMYYIEKDTKDYNLCDIRVLIANGDTPSDRLAEAERLYESWQNSDQTEETFIQMYNEFSNQQTGSSALGDGGLYEDVYKGKSTTEVTEWCFDASRKPGDVGIVKTYTGNQGAAYYLLYYVSSGENYRTVLARDYVVQEKMAELAEQLIDQFVVEVHRDVTDSVASMTLS